MLLRFCRSFDLLTGISRSVLSCVQFHIPKYWSSNLSAGWSDAAIQLQVLLQDATEFWSRVTLDQPGSSKQAWKKRLKVHQELVHDQATGSSHCAVQSCQGVGRGPRKLAHPARRLLLLEALCGLPGWWM